MENITKGPNIVFCKICGAMLTWEHPEGSGHYQASSDFIGGDICRSCLSGRKLVVLRLNFHIARARLVTFLNQWSMFKSRFSRHRLLLCTSTGYL